MMPNGMKMDPAMMRQSVNMMKGMSDEQLKSMIAASGKYSQFLTLA
jgi:hypothetical protein